MLNSENSTKIIQASYFMAYHSICIYSEDCQHNLEEARFLADNITDHIAKGLRNFGYEDDLINELSVWPYAIYYPYYEQYTTIFTEAFIQDRFRDRQHKSASIFRTILNFILGCGSILGVRLASLTTLKS